MNTRDEVIAFCLTMPDSYEDYPFHDANWTVMRYRKNNKGFAFVYKRDGRIWINVKCSPEWMEVWRKAFPAVMPAYHMNKQHWNTVELCSDVPPEEIEKMVQMSFRLTAPKVQGKRRG